MKQCQKPYSQEEREALYNFLKPISPMSIWNDPQFNQGAEQSFDDSKSIFLNKRLKGDKDSTTLKFVELLYKDQPEEKDPRFKDEQGKAFIFYFEDSDGKEVIYETAKKRNRFFEAMQNAKVEPGENITITRNGVEFETQYTIERAAKGFVPPVPPVDDRSVHATDDANTEEIPF